MNKKSPVRPADHVTTFRKWGRTNYAVFQSMHQVIRIGCLSVSYLLFAIPANAERNMIIAPHDSLSLIKDIEIEEVVVSAQRAPVTFSQVSRIVAVIEKDEIQHAPVQSLQDLLEFALNVDVRQRGGLGVQADISIRGGSFDQVLILLNGINIDDPQTGHHNLNLPVSLDAIERIEILEGPASRVYGLNAFSGAINIITGTSNNSNLKARLSGGQFGFYDSGLSGNIVTGKLTNFISVDHRSSDGYIKNTDFKLTDAYYLGKLATSAGIIELQAGNSDRAFGANSFYTPAYPDQYEKVNTTFTSLKMETGKVLHFTPSLYWRRNQDIFELFRYPALAPSWYKDHNYHLTDVYGSNLNAWFASGWGKTAIGADFRSENIWSTVLGKPLAVPIPIPGESGKEFTFADSRTNISFYLEHSIYLKNFSFSGGLMANWNSQLGRLWNVYPGLDASWNITKPLKLYFSVNKSLRMPTFTDLYYSSPTNIGNPLLKPEEATAFETGLKYNNSWLISHFTYFHRWGKNLIDWIKQPSETIWHSANITDLNTDGIEISAKIFPDKVFLNKEFIKSINISYSKLSQSKVSGTFTSQYVLDYLKNKVDIGLTHSIYKGFGANWQFSYQERNGTYTKWQGTSYGAEVPYVPVWLVDGRLYWQKKGTNIYFEGSNLLNKRYVDYGNVEQPGIWFKIGIVQQFNL
jgi:vitamin B12 transporter